MSKMLFIYALSDPRSDGLFRYVGYTSDLERRVKLHFYEAVRESYREKSKWFLEMRSLKLKPLVTVLETCVVQHHDRSFPNFEVLKLEREWILVIYELGHPLLNAHMLKEAIKRGEFLERIPL